MKALTLYNPHATLVALEKKRWETRSWRPRTLPKRIAIAAAAKSPADFRALMQLEVFKEAIGEEKMPDGAIVAVAEVTEIISTTSWLKMHCAHVLNRDNEREYMFGDYGPNRFAWRLENVYRLLVPIPCKGAQQLWNLPAEIESQIVAEMAGTHRS